MRYFESKRYFKRCKLRSLPLYHFCFDWFVLNDEGHVKMIIDYVNPEQWAIKFKRDAELTKRISDTLREAGY